MNHDLSNRSFMRFATVVVGRRFTFAVALSTSLVWGCDGEHGGNVSARDVPGFTVSVSNFRVNGDSQYYNRIVEITNPFAVHASDPVIAQTLYLEDQGIIQIEVGRHIGKTGRIVRELIAN